MTKLGEMTNDEIREEIEECFYSIYKDVTNRCYSKHSMTGVRHLQVLVRRNLAYIDRALLEIEVQSTQAVSTKETDKGEIL